MMVSAYPHTLLMFNKEKLASAAFAIQVVAQYPLRHQILTWRGAYDQIKPS
jgi:hypothetical protein